MNNDDGYILLYRSILTGRLLEDERPFHNKEAYIDLCLMAAFSDREVEDCGETVQLERNQVLISTPFLMKRWGWGNSRVNTFLKRLVMNGIVTIAKQTTKHGAKQTLTLINQGFEHSAKQTTKQTSKQSFEIEKEKETEKQKEVAQEKRKVKEIEKDRGYEKYSSPNPQAAFAECWSAYPKKERRRDAYKAFVKALKDGVTVDEIREGIRRFNEHVRRDHVDRQYIPQGGTWFNQRRWEDDYQLPEEKQSVDLSEVFK